MLNLQLPDNARVWVYQSTREFSADEAILLNAELNHFVDEWTSHRMEVEGEGLLAHNRFVILAADEQAVKLGGCSIDSSVRFVKSLEKKFDTNFFDRQIIAYRTGKGIQTCAITEFEDLLREGVVNDTTPVFNNLVQTKGELLAKWEIPYSQSWLKNLALARTSFKSIL